MIDFEQGIITALTLECPLVPKKSVCFVFLRTYIHRHFQELELSMAASGVLKARRASHNFSKVYK